MIRCWILVYYGNLLLPSFYSIIHSIHSIHSIQHPASSIQHPQHPQYPASSIHSIQHPASSIQHPLSSIPASSISATLTSTLHFWLRWLGNFFFVQHLFQINFNHATKRKHGDIISQTFKWILRIVSYQFHQ